MKNLLILCICLISGFAYSSHIAGGEITYEYIGGNQYRIKYVFFSECSFSSFPNSITVSIRNSSGAVVQNPSLTLVDTTVLNGIAPNPCTIVPNVCLIVGEFEGIVTLPPLAGGYQLSTDNCCRIGGIVNGPVGNAAYTTYIPGPAVAANNNSAIYNGWPPVFICHGQPFTFDNSATDVDGDSLSYSICTPYEGANPSIPYPFTAPFSSSNPLGGNTLAVDPITGELTGTPSMIGRFVVGICVSEWRNGVLINTSTRDFQLNVVVCQDVTVSSAINAMTNCNTKEVTFFNNSQGASSYFWDFGDGTTSTASDPIHNYPTYNSFNVTLIAYNAGAPQCNDTVNAMIAVVDTCSPCGMSVNVTTVAGVCDPVDGCAQVVWTTPCGSTAGITYGGTTMSGGCGGGSSSSGGSAPLYSAVSGNVDGVPLPGPNTTETITLLGPASPCTSSLASSSSGGNIIFTFNAVYVQPQSGAATANINGGTPPYNIQWTSTPTQTGPNATALDPGTYNVIVTDANGCVAVVPFAVAGQSAMNLNATATDISACGANDGTLNVTVANNNGSVTYLWSPGGYVTQSVSGVPPGLYTVQVTDSDCSTTDTVTVHDLANIIVDIVVTDITCPTDTDGSAIVTGTIGGAAPYTYAWTSNPVQTGTSATNLDFGFYTVTATDVNGCTGDTSFAVTGPVAMTTSISGTGSSCANVTDASATVVVTNGTPGYTYSWSSFPPQSGATANGIAGNAFYTVTVTDANGCVKKDSLFLPAPPPLNVDAFDISTITCAGVFDGAAYANVNGGQPDLNNNTTLYNEPFNTADLEVGCGSWHVDVSGGGANTIMDPSDYFRVINNEFAGQDLRDEGVWYSGIIDITGNANVTISGNFYECGVMEATDYIRAFYKINGGPEIQWFNLTDDGGVDCAMNSPSQGGLSGTTIQIVIRMKNDANEIHKFDNININGNVSGVLYNEPFNTNDLWNDPECDWWRDVTAGAINTDISGTGTNDHVETRSGAMEFYDVDGEIIWYSSTVDISSCTSSSISADFNYGGNMGATDYIRAYYSINGGPEILWADHTDDNAAGWPTGNPATDVLGGLTGNTIQIIVRCNNTGSSSFHTLDNVLIECETPNPNPYTFAWSCSGSVTDSVSGVPPGVCTVTVTDSAGCVSQSSVTIVNPGVLTATATATGGMCGPNNGTATGFGTGGNLPYTYDWSCSAYTTQTAADLPEGTNCTVTITDADGCTASASIIVPPDSIYVGSNTEDICSGTDFTYPDGTVHTNITANESYVSILTTVDGCDSLHTTSLNIIAAFNYTVDTLICSGSNYTYGDGTTSTNVTVAESHTSTLTLPSGCDSIVAENITIKPIYNITSNINACQNSLITYPDGSSATILGNTSNVSNLTTILGCDSIITTNVTMNPVYNIIDNIFVCENASFTYPDGTVVSITGNTSHISNLTTAASCDSIITTNITMNPITSSSSNINICSGSNYTYLDGTTSTNIVANENHISTVAASTGCDSIVTENLILIAPITNTINNNVCQGANFTYADGTTSTNITANENHISTLVAVSTGCDSLVTENLTVIVPVTSSANTDICSGSNFTYLDGTTSTNITVNENHVSTLVAASGCDSLVTQNLNIISTITNTVNTDICFDASHTYADGITSLNIQANESHISTLVTASGCDSVITENLTVIPISNQTVNVNTCENSTITYPDGTTATITVNTSYTSTLTSSIGCDSIIVTNVTMDPVYNITDNIDVCEDMNHTYPDGFAELITGNTSHISNLTSAAGCDSVITTNITMIPTTFSSVNINVCNGASFTYIDGTTTTNIVTNENHISTIVASTGCDSLVTENLIIVAPILNTTNTDVCSGNNFTYTDGTVATNITANQNHTSTLVAISTGCDSLVTENLNVINAVTSTQTIDICTGTNYTYLDGTTATNITVNENHVSTLLAASGCDSLVTENLNVVNTLTSTLNVSVCFDASYTYADGTVSNNIIINENHVSTLVAASGCDSIVTENLNVLIAVTNTMNVDVCFDGNYTYADGTSSTNITANESHISTLVAASGCDSIVTENVTSLAPITNTFNANVCSGDSYTYADGATSTNILANESHISILVSALGCDSTLTENIAVNPTYNLVETADICQNSSITYPDGTSAVITTNTSYTSNLTTVLGCDSIVVTNVTMHPVSSTTNTIQVCEASSYTFLDGTTVSNLTSNTAHTSNLVSSAGCDSVIIENLTVVQAITVTIDSNICSGTNYTFADASNFANVLTNQTHTSTLIASSGCDSIVTENLHVIPVASVSLPVDMIICPGESVMLTATATQTPVWNNGATAMSVAFTPTVDTFVVATVVGPCNTDQDTVFITVLSSPVIDAGADITIPLGLEVQLLATGGSTYLWNPFEFLSCSTCPDPIAGITETTTFIVTGIDDNGCKSKDTVIIIIDGEIIIYIPNIFSPNGDGENDLFKVFGPKWETYSMEIYNRWGGLVWQSENPNVEWNGLNHKGEECPQAVFIYKFRGTSTIGMAFEKSGNVMLSR